VTVPYVPRDFGQVWFAARVLLHGQNPYSRIGPGLDFNWPAPLFYPLPGVLLSTPLAPFSQPIACGLLVTIGVACFAWVLMRHGYGPLVGCCSASLVVTAEVAQWSPLFAAATVIPALGAVYVVKPQIGIAMFAVRPTRWPIVAGLLLSALSFAIQPTWLHDWRHGIDAVHMRADGKGFPYIAPVMLPGGFLALASLIRWRRPEARLVAALACAPQSLLLYDTLPLFLVPRTWKGAAVLAVASDLAQGYTSFYANVLHPNPSTALQNVQMGRAFTLLMYVPATIMVLRRPNEGAIPAWLERLVARWPVWLRGFSAAPEGHH
jgi:hypothetical protein